MQIATWQELFTIAGQLREERDLLIAQRDAAREALVNIEKHIDPFENGLQMFIAAEIETGLGKAS